MSILSLLSLIPQNSPKRSGMVSPEHSTNRNLTSRCELQLNHAQIFGVLWLQVFASKVLALRRAERYDISSVSPRPGEAECHASLTVAP